ncbi:MAG: hypothetical protein ACOY4K_00520 [Pseudomonadota bacterium]
MDLDFLDGGEPAEQPPAPEAPARGPDGRFVSQEPAGEPQEAAGEPVAEATPEPAPEPTPQPQPEPVQPGHVPITAMLEERDKRKALEERLRQIEAQRQQQAAPDPYEDPEGWRAWRDQQIEQRILNERLNFSERLARRDHGSETVDQARAWALERFAGDAYYYQKVMSSPDPYEVVVQDYKREQVFSTLQGNDLDAFLAWKAQQGAAPPQPAAPAAPALAVPATPPPRSLATATSAGGPQAIPIGEGAAFDALFKR